MKRAKAHPVVSHSQGECEKTRTTREFSPSGGRSGHNSIVTRTVENTDRIDILSRYLAWLSVERQIVAAELGCVEFIGGRPRILVTEPHDLPAWLERAPSIEGRAVQVLNAVGFCAP